MLGMGFKPHQLRNITPRHGGEESPSEFLDFVLLCLMSSIICVSGCKQYMHSNTERGTPLFTMLNLTVELGTVALLSYSRSAQAHRSPMKFIGS
jgi:hypothetical protein